MSGCCRVAKMHALKSNKEECDDIKRLSLCEISAHVWKKEASAQHHKNYFAE